MLPARSEPANVVDRSPAIDVSAAPLMLVATGPDPASLTVPPTVADGSPRVKVGLVLQATIGGVASRLTDTDPVPGPPKPAEVAVHVWVNPAVSVVTEVGSQPTVETIADSGSTTDLVIPMSERYLPLVPRGPVTVGVTTGAV